MNDKIKQTVLDSAVKARQYEFCNSVPIRPNPLKLSKWMAEEISEVTSCIENIESKNGLTCVCKKGCSACCNQIIVVTSTECLSVKPLIENLSAEQKGRLKQRVLEQCRLLQMNGFSNKEVTQTCSLEKEKEIQRRYFSLNLPCVFLSDENSCQIYSNRPTSCWAYRFYGDQNDCVISAFPDGSIIFTDWERRVSDRMMNARKPKVGLYILPFGIKEVMEW